MNTPKLVSTVLVLPRDGNQEVAAIALAAAGATSTIEVFEGEVGVVDATADVTVSTAGVDYEVGDLITITPTNGGEPAVFEVATVDTGGEILTVTLSSAGSGFRTAGVHSTTTDSVAGAGAELTIAAVDDTIAVSIGKISCVANTSDCHAICAKAQDGISVLVTGASAKGYLYYK